MVRAYGGGADIWWLCPTSSTEWWFRLPFSLVYIVGVTVSRGSHSGRSVQDPRGVGVVPPGRGDWARSGMYPRSVKFLPPWVRWSFVVVAASHYCRATRSGGPWTWHCLSALDDGRREPWRCVSPSSPGLAGDTGLGLLLWWRRPNICGSCRARSEICGLSLFLPWLVFCGAGSG